MGAERRLGGGSGTQPPDAVLVDGVVLKDAGPWATTVTALLRHLERVGFDGAPRPVGDGVAPDGRWALTYVPGESHNPRPWSDETMGAVGILLRRLHEATASFVPPPGAIWQRWWLRDLPGGDPVIGHGDAAPWNIVGAAEALIDWEFAGPVDRSWELAYAVWLNAQLHDDDDIAERRQLPDAVTRARHIRAILDGYGMPRAERSISSTSLPTSRSTGPGPRSSRRASPSRAPRRSPTTATRCCGRSPGARAARRGSPGTGRCCASTCDRRPAVTDEVDATRRSTPP